MEKHYISEPNSPTAENPGHSVKPPLPLPRSKPKPQVSNETPEFGYGESPPFSTEDTILAGHDEDILVDMEYCIHDDLDLRLRNNVAQNSQQYVYVTSSTGDLGDDDASPQYIEENNNASETSYETNYAEESRALPMEVTSHTGNHDPEKVLITPDLRTNLQKGFPRFIPLFFIHGVETVTQSFTQIPNWSIIQSNIETILQNSGQGQANGGQVLEDMIKSYCPVPANICDFGVLHDPELSALFTDRLYTIAEQALKLPKRLGRQIPFLKSGDNSTIYLTRSLACSLIANAMLCTISTNNYMDGLNTEFNFLGLYHMGPDSKHAHLKKEKLKCFLEYFKQMERMPESERDSIISFERRCIRTNYDWSTATSPLSTLTVSVRGKIEDADGMLQVDFANRKVGGGVLRSGCFQEEIRFCISPELLCATLFTENLSHNEVMIITGTKFFSSYTGYGSSFRFQPLRVDPWIQQQLQQQYEHEREQQVPQKDNLGRDLNQVVVMDAWNFKPADKMMQYGPSKINRELHKCYVAFIKSYCNTPVATGNWGCGYFNGDPQLKFIIQWMAASVNQRPLYYFVDDDVFAREIERMRDLLIQQNVTVDKLYNIISFYEQSELSGNVNERPPLTVFEYLTKPGVIPPHKRLKRKRPLLKCTIA